MTDVLDGEGFLLRRAGPDDVSFWSAIAGHEEVEPFMAAVSLRDEEELLEELLLSGEEPALHGRFVLEADGERAGVMAFVDSLGEHNVAPRQEGDTSEFAGWMPDLADGLA